MPVLGDRLDERLVVKARVALGRGPIGAPDLHQVRVGDDVEEAGADQLGLPAEVGAPELIGVADRAPRRRSAGRRRRRPRPRKWIGADDVVEVALEQVRDPVLAPGHEVAFDPEPQRRLVRTNST